MSLPAIKSGTAFSSASLGLPPFIASFINLSAYGLNCLSFFISAANFLIKVTLTSLICSSFIFSAAFFFLSSLLSLASCNLLWCSLYVLVLASIRVFFFFFFITTTDESSPVPAIAGPV